MTKVNRRIFVRQITLSSLGLILPFNGSSVSTLTSEVSPQKLKFGIIADWHYDLIPDAPQRLSAFMKQVAKEKPDFIVSLGDFCFGKPANEPFVKQFANGGCPAYHVLGNHDMDLNTKEEMITFFGMPGKYYSFDHSGYHFVVLDANYLYKKGQFTDYQNGNFYVDDPYREFINKDQIEWFKNDIQSTKFHTIIFSHQSLYHPILGIKNRLELQLIMEEANKKAGYNKVIACFNGHNHLDFYREINGIHYFDINSMSYQWFNQANSTRYDKALYEKYKNMQHIALYEDPLYAFVRIEPSKRLIIDGVSSSWMASPPGEAEIDGEPLGSESTPIISDRTINL